MNTTTNGSSCSSPLDSTAGIIGQSFVYCLIFVVSLVGNSFIGIVVYKTQTLRKPINYFIVNMAISDLLYPIFFIPWNLTYMLLDMAWLIGGPLGQALCKVVPFAGNLSVPVSVQSLILIAVDRLGAVVFPLRSPIISSKMCPFFILATWIVAIAVYSPYLFAFKLVEYSGEMACEGSWDDVFREFSSFVDYFTASYAVFLYVPTVLLVILYSVIVIKLKTQKLPGEQLDNAERQRAKRNRNVLKMAIAIVVGFVFCWLPSSVINLVILFAWESDRTLPCGFYLYKDIAFFVSPGT